MRDMRSTRALHRNWPRFSLAAVIAAIAVLMTQGCCCQDEDDCCTDVTERQVTHTFVIAEGMEGCTDDAGVTCVCCVPRDITLRPSDKVRIVNTTDYDVTIDWAEGAEVVFKNMASPDTEIDAKKSVTLTIVDEIPEEWSEGFGSQLIVTDPGKVCTNLPSPGIDWD